MKRRIVITIASVVLLFGFTMVKNHRIAESAYEDQDVQLIFETMQSEMSDITNENRSANLVEDTSAENPQDNSHEINAAKESPANAEKNETETIAGTATTKQVSIESTDAPQQVSNAAPMPVAEMAIDENTRTEAIVLSYESLCEKYEAQLLDIQNTSERALTDLIDNAKAEYVLADPGTRRSLEFKSKMATKYFQLAGELELVVDRTVQSVLEEFKDKLENNNYDVDIIDELGKVYENEKSGRKNEILSEILEKTQESM